MTLSKNKAAVVAGAVVATLLMAALIWYSPGDRIAAPLDGHLNAATVVFARLLTNSHAPDAALQSLFEGDSNIALALRNIAALAIILFALFFPMSRIEAWRRVKAFFLGAGLYAGYVFFRAVFFSLLDAAGMGGVATGADAPLRYIAAAATLLIALSYGLYGAGTDQARPKRKWSRGFFIAFLAALGLTSASFYMRPVLDICRRVKVWEEGAREVEISLAGTRTAGNSFFAQFGTDFNGNGMLDDDEGMFEFGWGPAREGVSRLGPIVLKVVYTLDANGNATGCRVESNAERDYAGSAYKGGDEDEACKAAARMFRKDWNIVHIRRSPDAADAKVEFDLRK